MKKETMNMLALVVGGVIATALVSAVARKQEKKEKEERPVKSFTLHDIGVDLASVEKEFDLIEEELHKTVPTSATAHEPNNTVPVSATDYEPHPFPAWPIGENEPTGEGYPETEEPEDEPKVGHPVEEPLIISEDEEADDEEETV